MDAVLLLKFFSAFVFVIALMLLAGWGAKRLDLAARVARNAGNKRLKIVETLAIDPRRRLVLVRRDDREHLLVLGPQGETLVEPNIPAQPETVVEFSKGSKHVQV